MGKAKKERNRRAKEGDDQSRAKSASNKGGATQL
jgi:hypothetical protein